MSSSICRTHGGRRRRQETKSVVTFRTDHRHSAIRVESEILDEIVLAETRQRAQANRSDGVHQPGERRVRVFRNAREKAGVKDVARGMRCSDFIRDGGEFGDVAAGKMELEPECFEPFCGGAADPAEPP